MRTPKPLASNIPQSEGGVLNIPQSEGVSSVAPVLSEPHPEAGTHY